MSIAPLCARRVGEAGRCVGASAGADRLGDETVTAPTLGGHSLSRVMTRSGRHSGAPERACYN
ncbi:MAG: hypothetical protein OXF98_02065, partial [Rhodospirillaceae bacterium]|nr:hypothetical protein [Rhodospirillaceae bacterium]